MDKTTERVVETLLGLLEHEFKVDWNLIGVVPIVKTPDGHDWRLRPQRNKRPAACCLRTVKGIPGCVYLSPNSLAIWTGLPDLTMGMETIQPLYESLPLFIEALMEKYPSLETLVQPYLRAATAK